MRPAGVTPAVLAGLDREGRERRIHPMMNSRGARGAADQREGERAMVLESAPPAGASQAGEPAIRAVGLVKAFGAIRAVDDVTFDLVPGRIYGLLGPNGSGKTTLIRLLTGLTRASAGRAEILGTAMPSRAALGRIGYMTQSDGIYPALTVGENAQFFGAAYGVRGRDAAGEALGFVDLADRRGSIAGTLSGGQRRRLSLACALIHRPPVLFLDEPTVGIDPLLRVQFWTHFRALADAGATIVVSSHVMDEADRCDELLFIRSGKVIARGSGREVRAQAGTASLEEAFLRLGGDVEVTR
jgi:ABC-2 type transport system ATP-binding protein